VVSIIHFNVGNFKPRSNLSSASVATISTTKPKRTPSHCFLATWKEGENGENNNNNEIKKLKIKNPKFLIISLFYVLFLSQVVWCCRGYYRCTHRHGQGCLATKLVQRSDEDPNVFEVTYRGRHTCSQSCRNNVASAPLKSPRLTENKNHHHHHPPHHQTEVQQHKYEEKPAQEIVSNFASRLTVKTEGLEATEEENVDAIFPSFSFSSTPIGSENEDANLFCESMLENNFMGSLSPRFLSPATSESNMFPMSPFHMNCYGLGHNVQTSESDHTDIISAPTSVTNSPSLNLDFSLDKVELDPNYPFDNPDFFS
jgi:hypothetical protein